MFSRGFCETSYNIYSKEPIRQLLLHKHSFCLLFHRNLSSFHKRCLEWAQCFKLLARSQKLTFNPVKYLQWSLFPKMVNSLKSLRFSQKKLQCRCSTRFSISICKQPLKDVVKWKTKTRDINLRATFIHWFLI